MFLIMAYPWKESISLGSVAIQILPFAECTVAPRLLLILLLISHGQATAEPEQRVNGNGMIINICVCVLIVCENIYIQKTGGIYS